MPNLKNCINIGLNLESIKNKNEYINNISIHRLIQNLSPFLINEYNLTS